MFDKKNFGCLLLIAFCFISCKNAGFNSTKLSLSVGEQLIESLSDTRPSINCMSEKEAMTEAANYAIETGMASMDYINSVDPELKDCVFAPPVFEYIPQGDDSFIGRWQVWAVNDKGNTVANETFRSDVKYIGNPTGSGFSHSGSDRRIYGDQHWITKKEVEDLISYQFPNQKHTEPIFLSSPESGNHASVWYFAVGDVDEDSNTNSNIKTKGPSNVTEYFLDPYVKNPTSKIDFSKSLANCKQVNDVSIKSSYTSRLAKLDNSWNFYKLARNLRAEKNEDGKYVVSKGYGICDCSWNEGTTQTAVALK